MILKPVALVELITLAVVALADVALVFVTNGA